MCVCDLGECAHVQMYRQVHVEARGLYWSLGFSVFYFWRQVISLSLELIRLARLAGNEHRVSTCLFSRSR